MVEWKLTKVVTWIGTIENLFWLDIKVKNDDDDYIRLGRVFGIIDQNRIFKYHAYDEEGNKIQLEKLGIYQDDIVTQVKKL